MSCFNGQILRLTNTALFLISLSLAQNVVAQSPNPSMSKAEAAALQVCAGSNCKVLEGGKINVNDPIFAKFVTPLRIGGSAPGYPAKVPTSEFRYSNDLYFQNGKLLTEAPKSGSYMTLAASINSSKDAPRIEALGPKKDMPVTAAGTSMDGHPNIISSGNGGKKDLTYHFTAFGEGGKAAENMTTGEMLKHFGTAVSVEVPTAKVDQNGTQNLSIFTNPKDGTLTGKFAAEGTQSRPQH